MPKEWIIKRTIDYMKENYEGNLLELVESISPLSLRKFKQFIPIKSFHKKLLGKMSFLTKRVKLNYIPTYYFDEKFFKTVTSCNKDCFNCKYSIKLAKKIIKRYSF
jgi:hypothetical protein